MKNARQKKILELIDQQSIDRQEELMRLLCEAGFAVTQATVSRDIRELNLVKAATGEGGYRYVSTFQREKPAHSENRFEMIFRETVLKIDYAENIVLIKCFTGMANAACEVFDSRVWTDVVGTLSGDDTFMILMRNAKAAKELCEALQNEYLPAGG